MDTSAKVQACRTMERHLIFYVQKVYGSCFHKHGLDTDHLKKLPERFESQFKTVRLEQRRIHEAYSDARRKRVQYQKFFIGLIADFN